MYVHCTGQLKDNYLIKLVSVALDRGLVDRVKLNG